MFLRIATQKCSSSFSTLLLPTSSSSLTTATTITTTRMIMTMIHHHHYDYDYNYNYENNNSMNKNNKNNNWRMKQTFQNTKLKNQYRRYLSSNNNNNNNKQQQQQRQEEVVEQDEQQSSPQILMERLIHPEFPNRQIAKITLNRPKANAMGTVMISQLQNCLTQLEQQFNQKQQQVEQVEVEEDEDESSSLLLVDRCVVITSCSDRVFSAGADLKERSTMTQDQAAEFVTTLRNTMERLAQLPIPTIAAIEGVAVGGGLELALAADIRIASTTCLLGLPETTLAILPGAGGTQRLPRLIGTAKAKELIWTGRRIDGNEALQLGLINQLSLPGQATKDAIDLAWTISASGPIGIRASKEAIEKGMIADTMEDALEMERQCYAKVLPTQDRLEGLAAFREGRTPVYKGK